MSEQTTLRARAGHAGERGHRVAVVGAGMAGVLAAIKLREAGLEDVVVYEKAEGLGGTWRENRYPGLACDVPSHVYSYSFAPNPEWSHHFAPGPEIRTYFEDVARRHGVGALIRYRKEITRCTYAGGRWRLEAADGTRDDADFVIAATGVLHHPRMPDVEGLDAFEGPAFHSARWPDGLRLAGMRVGVVGTGSTATQIVTAIAGEVGRLTLFQRTAQWIMAVQNPAYTEAERAAFRARPEAIATVRADISGAFLQGFANALVDAESPYLEAIHAACVANLETSVQDPVLREKLRPAYRAACKRLVLSDGFYDAIQRPNAELVTERIERVEKRGVRTADGRLHELDVLVLATGFEVDAFMRPMEVVGRGATALADVWRDGPVAYLAVSIPDFPNFFMLNGPNGPVGNYSLIDVAELQVAYVMQLVAQVRSGACREVSATWPALRRFDADRVAAAKTTIWSSGCKSWYLDRNGVPMAWPWTFDHFIEEMRAPRLDDYDLR